MSEPPPLESLQVLEVRTFAAAQDMLLVDGSDMRADTLIPGLRVILSQAIDPTVINPAACYITIDVPFPESDADRRTWGGGLIGYRSRPLLAEVLPLDAQTLLWRPTPDIKRVIPTSQRALARLTVKPGLLRLAPEAPFPAPFAAAIGGPVEADYERWFWLVA